MSYETILTETRGSIALITLNRPQALNALCEDLMRELAQALDIYEKDSQIAVIILTGSEKAFAAGADIKEMQPKSYMDVYKENFITSSWERVAQCRKPTIAAVSGYALGGGCEIAMMCDIILAAHTAQFGQPEITIGTIPGAGGTQRLTRLIGKSKAMEMCLTGRLMDAKEAEQCGLVCRVVSPETLKEEAFKLAEKIARHSLPVTMMVKEAINEAYESNLSGRSPL